jgi:hypothetical protein
MASTKLRISYSVINVIELSIAEIVNFEGEVLILLFLNDIFLNFF